MARQKTEGNWEDVIRIVTNLKNGMPWHIARHEGSFMMVEEAWSEKNKALFMEYVEKGLPIPPDGITNITFKPPPVQVVSHEGKLYGIFRDVHGKLFREEIPGAVETASIPEKKTEKKKEW